MLRVRHLLIHINTDKGVFGTRQNFGDGLNVVRAENFMGKSSLVQSIIYAFGLEGMQSPSYAVPLAHALTQYLEYEEDGKKAKATVIDSAVSMEIENGNGEFLTVQRAIAGDRNRNLVTVWEGQALTKKEALSTSRDYYVREGGAATSDLGFHRRLKNFLGWELPMAPRFSEPDCPLYLETIFPLLYVEQKLGWGRLPARYPTWLSIRDVGRRTVEFILGLDAYANAIERNAVQEEIKRLRREWTRVRAQAEKSSSAVIGMVRGIPLEPVASWPPEIAPSLSVMRETKWIPMAEYLAERRARLTELHSIEVPSTASAAPSIRDELAKLEENLAFEERTLTALFQQFESDTAEAESLKQRIESITDDLRKYKDLRKVRKMGSKNEPDVIGGHCPTCHQEIADSLLDTGNKAVPMDVDQNVSFYEEQIQLFSAVHGNSVYATELAEKEIQVHRFEVNGLRQRIRDMRETLVSASSSPSIEAISERVRLEDRITRIEAQEQMFEDYVAELAELSSEWHAVQERLKKLPKGTLSGADQDKISGWQTSFRDQLTTYKMGSLDIQEVYISLDTYKPQVEKINLEADVSASDLIRLHWAYLLALMEIGTKPTGNHPGFLVFDEPQQQSVKENSFQAMLRHAQAQKDCQIIVTTSHERESIDAYLKKIGVSHVAEFGLDHILQKMSA